MNNLSARFNQPGTILVISSYPDLHRGIKDLNAVAWHSQKTLHSLATPQQKVVVFAETTGPITNYTDGQNILVIRSWTKGNFLSLLKTFFQSLTFTQAKTVLFQFEFNIFGGVTPVLFIPLLLLCYRLLGKKVIFELHQVITDLHQLSKHLNLTNQLILKIYNQGLQTFYKVLGIFANHIVVLEEELSHRLSPFIPLSKINFIPISISKPNKINQNYAKNKLGYKSSDFVILSFGYINWYKGSDWIANTLKNTKSKLILGGGPSPTLADKPYYQNFYKKVNDIAKNSHNITITGFIPENKISTYFTAADLVVLPYRVFMSSSGPLSWAFSYQKPVIMANTLKKYQTSIDFSTALTNCDISPDSIFFSFNQKKFIQKISSLKNSTQLQKLTTFSKYMNLSRSVENVTTKYNQLISNYETTKIATAISD